MPLDPLSMLPGEIDGGIKAMKVLRERLAGHLNALRSLVGGNPAALKEVDAIRLEISLGWLNEINLIDCAMTTGRMLGSVKATVPAVPVTSLELHPVNHGRELPLFDRKMAAANDYTLDEEGNS